MMGMVSSPYICIKAALLADEVAKGDHLDSTNPFQWQSVTLNLPGEPSYDPRQPWEYRVRQDEEMASEVVTYVDDMRPVGHSQDSCWAAAHALACWYCWLGIQVSSRKTRPPSWELGRARSYQQALRGWVCDVHKTSGKRLNAFSVSCLRNLTSRPSWILRALSRKEASLSMFNAPIPVLLHTSRGFTILWIVGAHSVMTRGGGSIQNHYI